MGVSIKSVKSIFLVEKSGMDIGFHLRHFSHSVDCEEHILLSVEIENWSGLLVVGSHSLSESFFVVVWSLHKILAGDVILSLDLWWVELDVIRSSGRFMNSSSLNSLD